MMHQSMSKDDLAKYVDRMYQRMIGREEIAAKCKTIEQVYREGK